MSKYLLSVLVLVLAGCAPMVWNKPGATEKEFELDRLTCTELAQRRYMELELAFYTGESSNEMVNENGLFASCMNGKGWHLGPQQVVIGNARGLGIQNDQFTPTALRDAFKEIHAEQDALCKRPEFAAIYARSACHLGDLTISQLADSSRLANADKAAFSKVRKESQDIGRKAAAAYRAFGGDRGRRVAAAIDRAEVMAERNGVDLYQGHITWGEYSQRRREVNQVYRDEFRRIHNQPR